MRGRSALLIAGLAITGSVLATTRATAKPIDKGHFHDVFTSDVYECDGPRPRTAGTFRATSYSISAAHRRSRTSGRACAAPSSTNLENDGTYPTSSPPTAGTTRSSTTATAQSPSPPSPLAAPAFMTPTASSCRDPGQFRFAFDIDYNGTPGNPGDDVDVPDSFRVVRDSTGRNDLEGRDFCADVVEFTTP